MSVTICAKCKHCRGLKLPFDHRKDYEPICIKSLHRDLVFGLEVYCHCRSKNDGNCPDYEAKEEEICDQTL